MLTRSHIRLLLIAVLGALLLLPLLPGTARACSCAQLTITQAMEAGRHPSEAVAIVTRVDDGGDIEGRVEVVEIVSGRLPDAFDVTMDDGGSCQPAIQVGATVGLLVDTAGEEPVARECSLLDQASVLAHLHGPLQPDTDATGPPALAVLGRMRSTDTEPAEPPLREQPSTIALLDAQLRTLAVASLPSPSTQAIACEGSIALIRRDASDVVAGLDGVAEAYGLPDLDLQRSRVLPRLFDRSRQLLGCTTEGVALGANGLATDGAGEFSSGGTGVLYPDVFGGTEPIDIPGFHAGAVAGTSIVLLTSTAETGSEITVTDLAGAVTDTITVPGDRLYEVLLSPDGSTLAAWGGEDVLLTADVGTGTILGRLQEPGLMLASGQPWLDEGTLALLEGDDGPYLGPTDLTVSVRDTELVEVGRIDGLTTWPQATTAGLVTAAPQGLVAVHRDGASGPAAPQTALVDLVIGLGVPLDPPSDAPPAPSSPTPAAPGLPLPTDPPAEPTTTTPPSPPVIPVAPEPGGVSATEAVGIVGAALAGLAGMVVVVGRRRVRDGRRPGDG